MARAGRAVFFVLKPMAQASVLKRDDAFARTGCLGCLSATRGSGAGIGGRCIVAVGGLDFEEKDLDGRRAHHCFWGACCGETDSTLR